MVLLDILLTSGSTLGNSGWDQVRKSLINKLGYVYHPWEDYEAMLKGNDIVLLDITRLIKKRLSEEDFVDFYFGVPFCSPEIIKPKRRDDPAIRLYWRGISERDYFGTDRSNYLKLFLEGIKPIATEKEFKRVQESLQKWIQ